ncbi:MAG TPA: dihydrodipicolinate synthase family protein [bacterium]|nr:dihydrodipicolinate synthase family protein [bacterium]
MTKVHTAGDEVEALMLQGLLEQAGIPVVLRSRQVPGYADVVEKATGVWGDLLVPDERAGDARTLIRDYLATQPRTGPARGAGAAKPVAGIVVPIPTLFDERGRLDESANARHVEWLIAHGVHGLFALGTTGEFTSLTRDERRMMAELVVRTAGGRVPVLVGCGSPWTDEAVAYAEHAEEIGAAGVAAVLPYYWIPSDRSIYEHYRLLAIGTRLPVYIYNFPALTGRNIPPDLVRRLAEQHPTIAGIKDTIDSVAHIQQLLVAVRPARPDFAVLCGMDYHLLNTMLLGGDGAVPGTANFAPDPLVEIYRAVTQGRAADAAERARTHLNAIPALFAADAPAFVVVKEAMVIAGLIPHATTRPPALPLTEDERRVLRRGLEALGIGAARSRVPGPPA